MIYELQTKCQEYVEISLVQHFPPSCGRFTKPELNFWTAIDIAQHLLNLWHIKD